MRTARNVHEHGLEYPEVETAHNNRLVFPNGLMLGTPICVASDPKGKTVVLPTAGSWTLVGGEQSARVISLGPGIRLMPIENSRGETLMPPSVGALKSQNETEAATAGRLYLDWLKEQISSFC